MKVSDITIEKVAEYLRIDDYNSQTSLLQGILDGAIDYVKGTTNLTVAELDEHSDIAVAVLVLCQDMYDTRSMYVDKGNANRVVASILHMYRENFV